MCPMPIDDAVVPLNTRALKISTTQTEYRRRQRRASVPPLPSGTRQKACESRSSRPAGRRGSVREETELTAWTAGEAGGAEPYDTHSETGGQMLVRPVAPHPFERPGDGGIVQALRVLQQVHACVHGVKDERQVEEHRNRRDADGEVLIDDGRGGR